MVKHLSIDLESVMGPFDLFRGLGDLTGEELGELLDNNCKALRILNDLGEAISRLVQWTYNSPQLFGHNEALIRRPGTAPGIVPGGPGPGFYSRGVG